MKTGLSFASYKGTRLSATCLNIMAKFVHLARQQEQLDLHLQDKHVLQKIEDVAMTTKNQRLLTLYGRLKDELIKQDFHHQDITHMDDINDLADNKPKSLFSSILKDWSRPFK